MTTSKISGQKRASQILVFIAILFNVLRFVNLDNKTYWSDEAATLFRLSGHTTSAFRSTLLNHGIHSADALDTYQSLNSDKGLSDILTGLIAEEPQLPPLYYTLLYLWTKIMGDSRTMVRAFSAFLSVIASMAMYGLAKVIFKSSYTALVATALFSVSPFFFLYAQEARLYMLWVSLTLLSNTFFIKAVENNNKKDWLVYAVLTILSLYSYPFSIFTILCHGAYIILTKGHSKQVFLSFFFTCFIAFLFYVPWMFYIYEDITKAGNVGQITSSIRIPALFTVINFFINVIRAFFDVPSSLLWKATPDQYSINELFIGAIFLFLLSLISYAFYFLIKHSSHKTKLFLVLMVLVVPVLLITSDLLFGGIRSIWPRYQMPCFIGLILLLASITTKSFSHSKYRHRLTGVITIFILAGIGSCLTIVTKNNWWNKYYGNDNNKISKIINDVDSKLLLLYTGHEGDQYLPDHYVFSILSLSHHLGKNISLSFVDKKISQNISEEWANFNQVFLFNPSDRFLKADGHDNDIELVYRDDLLKDRGGLSLWEVTIKKRLQ